MFRAQYLLLLASGLAAACSSSTESVSPLTIADLKNTQWQATMKIWSTDSVDGIEYPCSTAFPLTFDGALFASPDSLYVFITGDAKASCPGKPDVPWAFRGMNLIVVQSADTIVMYRFNGYPFSHLTTASSTKLVGTVPLDYRARGPLVLTR